MKDLKKRLDDGAVNWPWGEMGSVAEAALIRIEALEDALRQIADSGDGSNARLAAQALEDGHE